MRGGSIPFLVWGTLNLVLLIINWIWADRPLQVAQFGFVVVVIYTSGLVLLLRRREAIRRGPPEYRPVLDPLPRMSFAAAGIGLSVGLALFGLVFGSFLYYIGAAVFVLSLLRLGRELRWERRTIEAMQRERRL